MRITITGVGGFVGHHLVRELSQNNIEVVGITHSSDKTSEIDPLMSECKRVDLAKLWPDIDEVDVIIHLAGLAAVGPSFDEPQKYIDVNSAIMTNLGEYYLAQGGKMPRIIVVSSGAVYDPNQSMPLSENAKIAFNSPYSVSKVLVENQAKYYGSRGLDCVVMRPFNHIGPGQKPGFLLPDLASQLKAAEQSGSLEIGNLETKRDYTDVRDVVRAYRLLATADELKHDTYNICSGRSVAGTEILRELQKLMKLDNLKVEIDKDRFRPSDAPDIVGDNSRLDNELGWQPEINLEQTIKDFLDEEVEKA